MSGLYLKRLLILPVLGFGCACLASDRFPAFPKEDFPTVDARLRVGDELFSANLNARAIATYQEVLETTTELQTLMQARFHLALAYISQNAYVQAIPLLQENVAIPAKELSASLETLRRNSLYTLALTFQHVKEDAAAKETLAAYLCLSVPPALVFGDEARFELAHLAFHQHDDKQAESLLTSVVSVNGKPRLKALAYLYLARIHLAKNHPEHALTALDQANKTFDRNDPLFYEWSYLRGEVAFQLHEFSQAITFFNQSIPPSHPERSDWYADSLYYIGWSYLKDSDGLMQNREELAEKLKNGENAFRKMLAIAPQEKAGLALAQCLLIKAGALQDKQAYTQAEEILSAAGLYTSLEGKAHALLLRAEAAPTYEMRDQFYRQLTQEENAGSSFYAKGWYMRGLNDFEQGLALEKSADKPAAQSAFERASTAFKKAFDLLHDTDKAQAGAAIKYQALAIGYSGQPDADLTAFRLIDSLMHDTPTVWGAMPNPDEIHYLHGYFSGHLAEQSDARTYLPIAAQSLKAAAASPAHKFGDIALRQLGCLYYHQGEDANAEAAYLQLANTYPESPYAAEAWYWSACCADRKKQDRSVCRERRQHVYESYPHSPYAAEAYFTFYNYQEYLQGDRGAIKHLESFIEKYPTSPFLIEAYYLIGLDYKRDRKTPEGKWIRKKSHTEAIDAFQHVETLFDDLREKGKLPEEKIDTYASMRYRATLERAMANLAIAGEAQGAKKQIYLDYAEEVFKKLIADLSDPHNQYTQRFFKHDPLPSLAVECTFGLAQTHLKAGDDGKAEPILAELVERYRQNGLGQGYYLARSWDELGNVALRRNDYAEALQRYKKAEEASKGGLLSTDQKLDMWIQQSYCFRGLKQYDDAILILSKVVNDDAISSLRMKAMYLRAETYEQQRRLELARKQLESMIKKGGSWARKAKEKLEKDYGY